MKQNILLIVTGSVAIIKAKKLYKMLINSFNVKVIATPYVRKHYRESLPFENENLDLLSFPQHVEYAKWANLIVVAPASANTLAKFANGIADNQVLATLLAARSKILFAPAMNTYMYEALQNRQIIAKIAQLGHFFIGPETGMLWEKEVGIGRMSEPQTINEAISNYFKKPHWKVLIVNNASRVAIDPIRYITTKASGVTGELLANELLLRGFATKVIDVSKYDSETLLKVILELEFDLYISVAAINDFQIKKSKTKIKKQNELTLKLTKAIDVVSEVAKLNKKIITFKNDENKQNAITKLNQTKSEFVVWTKIGAMGNDFATGAIIFNENKAITFEKISKLELAKMIAQEISKLTTS